jgi:hypothetical protein
MKLKPLDMRSTKISWPILVLLVAALGLIAFTFFRSNKSDDTAPTPPAPAARVKPPASSAEAASAPDAVAQTNVVDLFPAQNWNPPPPPPPPPEALAHRPPPPPPEPPPLPFSVRSLWLDTNGVFYVVLAGPGREFPMCIGCSKTGFSHKGDTLLNAYKIDDLTRKEVRFTYLPLKRRQTLALGELK